MRTHLLEQLDIRGKAQILQRIPGFDFYQLRQVERIEWSSAAVGDDPWAGSATFLIQYDAGSEKLLSIRLVCTGVRMLRLPTLASVFTMSELEIEDLRSSQLEGVRYRLKDYGESDLDILCRGIAIEIVSD